MSLSAQCGAKPLHLNVLITSATSLIGLTFSVVMARRFVSRRQPYYLIWTLGLLWYALATGSEAIGAAAGWSPAIYKLWYVTGAIGVAAYLGAGTLYLHRDPPFGSLAVICVLGSGVPALATNHLEIGFLALGAAVVLGGVLTFRPDAFALATTILLLLASVAAAYIVATAHINPALLPAGPDQIVSGQAFDADTRALTPPFNIAGALVLILGALLSAIQLGRTHALSNRLLANILIAVGAFVPSVASGLTRFGVTSLFFVGELLGLGCILAGFLLSAAPAPGGSSRP
jgi:hypothetical protein